MTDPTIQGWDDGNQLAAATGGGHDEPPSGLSAVSVSGTTGLTDGGVHNAGEDRGPGPRKAAGRRRSRRVFGSVERLPSGRFRARVIGPDSRYVSAPATFANRTDAARWVDVQHADLFVYELLGVLVGGDQHGLDSPQTCAFGHSGQHVVGLVAR